MENENFQIEERLVREISLPIFSSKGWVKLLGILMLVYGIFLALSIVGIIIAWLPIWLGILLMQASSRINIAHLSGSKEALIKAQNNLSTYFTVYGVLALIGIIGSLIAVIVVLSTGVLTHLDEFRNDFY